ncbi:bystin [Ixodes scapularis]
MGKASRIKVGKTPRNVPLDEQMKDDVKPGKLRSKVRHRKDDDEMYVDDKLTRRILDQARKQQEDLEEEHGLGPSCSSTAKEKAAPQVKLKVQAPGADSSDDEELDDVPEDDSYYETIEVDEADEKALEMFMSENKEARRTLADIIMEKLKEHETEIQSRYSDAGSIQMADLDPKVVEMFRGVKKVLSRYRSGKLPKAFKIIPALSNWEQVLYLTDPDSWSSGAMYQATRIFASNLKDKMAQRQDAPAVSVLGHPAAIGTKCPLQVLQSGPLATGARRHLRVQEAQLPPVPGSTQGAVQARGFLQGHSPSPL